MKKLLYVLLLVPLAGCDDISEKISQVMNVMSKPNKSDIIKHLGSDNCLQEYYNYWDYEPIKAFATASDESCGWSGSNHKTIEDAKTEALEQCEANREDGTPCKVVDVNGAWQ